MKFNLQKGQLLRRYKRFLADVELNGKTVTAHCANPGSMAGLCDAGQTVWLEPATGGKLKWRWQICGEGNQMVGINTHNANTLASEALANGKISEVAAYPQITREHKVGDSRLDFLLQPSQTTQANLPPNNPAGKSTATKPSATLATSSKANQNRTSQPSTDPSQKCYLEVKNVTLSRTKGTAEFPDAVTLRGQKHLRLLAELAQSQRAVLLFVVQRSDCSQVKIAQDIDPQYATLLAEAVQSGVEVLAYGCSLSAKMVEINRKLDFIIPKAT